MVANVVVSQCFNPGEGLWTEGNDTALCIEFVVVIQQSDVILGSDLPIDLGKELDVITAPCARTQVAVNQIENVRYALQINWIGRIRGYLIFGKRRCNRVMRVRSG